MRRLLLAVVLIMIFVGSAFAQSCPPGGCDAPAPAPAVREPAKVNSPTYRVCFRSQKMVGGSRKGADCRVCMLKAGSQVTEKDCYDFYTSDTALRFWDENCCD